MIPCGRYPLAHCGNTLVPTIFQTSAVRHVLEVVLCIYFYHLRKAAGLIIFRRATCNDPVEEFFVISKMPGEGKRIRQILSTRPALFFETSATQLRTPGCILVSFIRSRSGANNSLNVCVAEAEVLSNESTSLFFLLYHSGFE